MQTAKQYYFRVILKTFLKTAARMMFKYVNDQVFKNTCHCIHQAKLSNKDKAFTTAPI